MDKALSHNQKFTFGEVINATAAHKGMFYTCLKCGDEVFLKKGTHNKAHFSHFKQGSNDENECEERVGYTFHKPLRSSSLKKLKRLEEWFKQQSKPNSTYLPQLPEVIFDDKTLWQSLANILVLEVKTDTRVNKSSFIGQVTKKLNIANSENTRYFIVQCAKEFNTNKLNNLYWEIYLRFRLLYSLFNKQQSWLYTGNYLNLISFINDQITTDKKGFKGIPYKFYYDETSEEISCYQDLENYTKVVKLSELSGIRNNRYLIAVFDEFENRYISTNAQVAIDSEVMILGNKNILLELVDEIKSFTDSDLILYEKIDNRNRSLAAVITRIQRPNVLEFGKYPSLISFRYIELLGGLRLSNDNVSNTYMLQCPPIIKLNVNIPNTSIEILNYKNEIIEFNRSNNILDLLEVKTGQYSVRIKQTPYYLNFNLESRSSYNKIINKENNISWLFSNQWPKLCQTINESKQNYLNGVNLFGPWEKSYVVDRNKEWFFIHSGLKSEAVNMINKII